MTPPKTRRGALPRTSEDIAIKQGKHRRSPFAKGLAAMTYRLLRWGEDRVPLGIRSLVGIAFMIGGVFGFLPILGFWMFPLGLAFVALDIPWTRRRIHAWMLDLKTSASD